jgi:hypothetical protein
MERTTLVKYIALGVAVVTLVSLVATAPLQVIALVAVYGVHRFYTPVV